MGREIQLVTQKLHVLRSYWEDCKWQMIFFISPVHNKTAHALNPSILASHIDCSAECDNNVHAINISNASFLICLMNVKVPRHQDISKTP